MVGVKVGQNLLALDLARVKRDLEMVSAIRSATVERMAPHTLKLRVSEREPLAQFSVLRLKSDGTAKAGQRAAGPRGRGDGGHRLAAAPGRQPGVSGDLAA